MKNLKIIILFIFVASVSSNAQNVNYKTISDNPDDLNNLSIQVYPSYVAVSSGKENNNLEEEATVPVGWGLGIRFNPIPVLNDRFGFNMKYMRSYIEIPAKADENDKKIRNTYFEFGGTFNFFNKEKVVDEKLVLSSSSRGNTTTTESLTIPMTRKTVVGLAGGIFRVKSPIDIGPVTSVVSGLGFYGGLRFTRKINFEALVSGYGVKSHGVRNSWYINALYIPKVNYTDEEKPVFGFSTPETFDTKHQMDSAGLINKMGLVVGYELEFNPHKSISMSIPFEFGVKPPFNGYYIYLGFAISVNLDFKPNFLTNK